jgi:hypothetical protein
MNSEEFKDLMYPFTCQDMSDITGYSKRTIQNWRQGINSVPLVIEKAYSRNKLLIYLRYNKCESARSRYKKDLRKGDIRALKLNKEL